MRRLRRQWRPRFFRAGAAVRKRAARAHLARQPRRRGGRPATAALDIPASANSGKLATARHKRRHPRRRYIVCQRYGGDARTAVLFLFNRAEALHKVRTCTPGRKILPVGHETAERARHLLDKANTILNSDPMRSAEVEYYMQQVRTIVQRMRQAHRWSDLYRNRLRLYLVAWALLAIIVLSALALFPWEAEDFAAWLTAAANDSLFVINFVGFAGTVMAGALGGSLGALLTMRRHANAEYSLFDRKYGLRGLLLPVIGALAGGVIYLIFGATYYFVRINPSLSVAAMAAPALLAFVLGFSQESIYGTRE